MSIKSITCNQCELQFAYHLGAAYPIILPNFMLCCCCFILSVHLESINWQNIVFAHRRHTNFWKWRKTSQHRFFRCGVIRSIWSLGCVLKIEFHNHLLYLHCFWIKKQQKQSTVHFKYILCTSKHINQSAKKRRQKTTTAFRNLDICTYEHIFSIHIWNVKRIFERFKTIITTSEQK